MSQVTDMDAWQDQQVAVGYLEVAVEAYQAAAKPMAVAMIRAHVVGVPMERIAEITELPVEQVQAAIDVATQGRGY